MYQFANQIISINRASFARHCFNCKKQIYLVDKLAFCKKNRQSFNLKLPDVYASNKYSIAREHKKLNAVLRKDCKISGHQY
jgi:hypothetical protein